MTVKSTPEDDGRGGLISARSSPQLFVMNLPLLPAPPPQKKKNHQHLLILFHLKGVCGVASPNGHHLQWLPAGNHLYFLLCVRADVSVVAPSVINDSSCILYQVRARRRVKLYLPWIRDGLAVGVGSKQQFRGGGGSSGSVAAPTALGASSTAAAT